MQQYLSEEIRRDATIFNGGNQERYNYIYVRKSKEMKQYLREEIKRDATIFK